MGYTAGTLDLSILGMSDSAVASIDKTVKSLNSLSRAITQINNTQFVLAGQKLEVLFNKIAQSTNSINTANIENLASAAKSLSAISKIGNLEKVDYSKVGNGFNTLTVSITPFIAKVKEAEASLTALYGILNKSSGKKIGGLLGGNSGGTTSKKGTSSLGGLLNLGKWSAVLYAGRRLGRVMANIVTKGSDFGETLNLWSVAMGDDFLPQATEFVNKLNEAYGISKETLMNSQAIFKNMLGSLGEISSAQAYQLSEGITQMALDYASLYNVQFEDAMTKFQAALAGQVRPIRSVSGYDITENTLFQLYQQLGGTKTMRQLSRTEKQLLAIYAVFEQMGRSGATGDLERTINNFANQTRVTKDSWKDIQTYAGLTITRLIESSGIMKYVNAVLIFMSRILEGVATSLDTGLGESGDVFGDMENGVTNTTEAVEGLQSALLDFDKFRALDQTSTVSDSLGLDETILDAMSEYDSILGNAELEARQLADSWLASLGLIDENNDGIIDMQNGIEDISNLISNIDWGDVASSASDFIIKSLEDFNEWLKNIDWEDVGKDLADFVNGIKWSEMFEELGETIRLILVGAGEALLSFLEEIDWNNIFAGVEAALVSAILPALGIIAGWLGALIYELFVVPIILLVEACIEGAYHIIAFIWNSIAGIIDAATNAVIDVFNFFGADIEHQTTTIPERIDLNWMDSIPRFESGGLPDKGSMFYAGEGGAEIVYNMPSGQSGVANIQQIAQATYSGTMRALNDWWGGSGAKGDIPQLKEANPTGMYQAVTGVAKAQGKVWANV